MKPHPSQKGVVLIIVLWILVIMTLLVVGLGRRARVEMSLARATIGQLRARYLALAGVTYTQTLLARERMGGKDNAKDTLWGCGVGIDSAQDRERIFHDITVGEEGRFDLSYVLDPAADPTQNILGIADEQGRIDLNVLHSGNYKVFAQLLIVLGYNTADAEQIAAAVIDWIDSDDTVSLNGLGAESEFYKDDGRLYPCKNALFDSVEELSLVRGVSPELVSRVRDYLTVFPRGGGLQINFDTASLTVLRAFARSLTGAATNTTEEDADRLAEQIVEFRSGPDGLPATNDDRIVDSREMGLDAKETALFLSMSAFRVYRSRFLRVHVQARDANTSVRSRVDAVLDRNDGRILSFYRRQPIE